MTAAKVYTEGIVPLKVWTDSLEEEALEQALHMTNLPFSFRHAAVMADGHRGYGVPIGAVLVTRNVVVPYAVGVDCGCGVRAWKTEFTVEEFMPKRDEVMKLIQELVPVGFHKHPVLQDDWLENSGIATCEIPVVDREYDNSRMSLGTLGGGNHFIEIQADEDDNVWAMIHSGSRNLGKQVCDQYNKVAEDLNARWHSAVPKEWQLAFLPVESDEGQSYLREMNLCLEFAKANRNRMMESVNVAFSQRGLKTSLPKVIDVHHNYAAIENHFKSNVWVHRKGAVKAVGTVLIPGSMGSHSYIGKGLESPESFKSCSHGAGRSMGRRAALRAIEESDVLAEMKVANIGLYVANSTGVAAESRQSYHDIDVVMANQSDLVEITQKLRPLAVVKDVK